VLAHLEASWGDLEVLGVLLGWCWAGPVHPKQAPKSQLAVGLREQIVVDALKVVLEAFGCS